MAQELDFYPDLSVKYIENPNRLYAVPALGGLIKFVICIPQFIMVIALAIAVFFVTVLFNPLYVLITGKYLSLSYTLVSYLATMSVKIHLFFLGLSDTYPGFDFNPTKDFTLSIEKPTNPSRLLAIPLLGGFTRALWAYGFLIYTGFLSYAVMLGAVISSFIVLFTGKYPHSVFDLGVDVVRMNISVTYFFTGISDTLPSTRINTKHNSTLIKLFILLALPIMLMYVLSFVAGLLVTPPSENKMTESEYQQLQENFNNSLDSENGDSSNLNYTYPATQ